MYSIPASVEAGSLHVDLSAEHFPLIELADVDGPTSPQNPEESNPWLKSIPRAVLAHEDGHLLLTATTASGLRDLFELHNSVALMIPVIEEFRGNSKDLEIPSSGFLSQIPESKRSTQLQQLLTHNLWLEVRWGGRGWAEIGDEHIPSPEVMVTEPFFVSVDPVSLRPRLKVMGTRDLQEGFGPIVELLRAGADNTTEWSSVVGEPYISPIEAFISYRRQPAGDVQVSDLFECAVAIDTAMMLDPWTATGMANHFPGVAFRKILEVLRDHHELQLTSLDLETVTQFQNSLILASGVTTASVQELTSRLVSAVDPLFEVLNSRSGVPHAALNEYERSVRDFLEFRVEFFDGACPLEVLVYAPDHWLRILMLLSPSGTYGAEAPLTSGHTDQSLRFGLQVARQIRPTLYAALFGDAPCGWRKTCLLPVRPSCAGVTGDTNPLVDCCPREVVIKQIRTGMLD